MAKKLVLNSKIGVLGEDIAALYLAKRGFSVLFRNYLKKWGEIDIIAQKDSILHFIEVKSVTRENISRVTEEYNPLDGIHRRKQERLARVIQSYLLESSFKGEWQVDVVLVYVQAEKREAKVEVISNIIL